MTRVFLLIEWIQSSNLWSITTYHMRCRLESKDGLTTRGAGLSSVLDMIHRVYQKLTFDKALDQMLLVCCIQNGNIMKSWWIIAVIHNLSSCEIRPDKNSDLKGFDGYVQDWTPMRSKLSLVFKSHQNTHSSVKYEVIWKCHITLPNVKY